MSADRQPPDPPPPTDRPGATRWFEPVALGLLSLATVGTAWCSYQAAAWVGVSQSNMNLSAALGRKAAAQELQSLQYRLADVMLFSQYINARAGSNETLAGFYADRFRGEAKSAFDAWMAQRPFENPAAAPHPFVTNFYQPALLAQAAEAQARSEGHWQQAGEAGRNSRGYVLTTVLLAMALFCGGTASKFESLWMRRSVLGLGLGAVFFALSRLVMLPCQF